ncbi:MAG: hypothetical protein V1674_01950 [Candidatus Omnitrophota bacterium]
MKKIAIFFAIILAVVIFTGTGQAGEEETVEIPLSGRTVVLHWPLKLEQALYYRDGGTIGIVIKDREENTFQFCLDARLSVKKHQVYVGAVHPEASGAETLSFEGKEEKAIVAMLEEFIRRELSPERQKEILEKKQAGSLSEEENNLWLVLEFIRRIKDPAAR